MVHTTPVSFSHLTLTVATTLRSERALAGDIISALVGGRRRWVGWMMDRRKNLSVDTIHPAGALLLDDTTSTMKLLASSAILSVILASSCK